MAVHEFSDRTTYDGVDAKEYAQKLKNQFVGSNDDDDDDDGDAREDRSKLYSEEDQVLSGLNDAIHMDWDDGYDEVDQQTATYEEKMLKILDRYKIDKEVDKSVFEPYIGKTATGAIDKIIRESETSFKIVGKKILGLSAINENASIKIVKSGTIGKVTGVMVTISNLPNISLSYSNETHKINQFIMKGNNMNYVYKNKHYSVNYNTFK